MKENRDKVIELVFGSEKGFVNRPQTDNGGPTNLGITQATLEAWRGRPVTVNDVMKLQKLEAYDIYASEYWRPIRGDDLPAGLDYAVFDSCVTSGANRAARLLQCELIRQGADIIADGNIGIQTIRAIKQYPGGVTALIQAYCNARIEWMKTLSGPKGFKSNGRGWTIRITGVDPKGEWKTIPGVVGVALSMAVAAKAQAAGADVVPQVIPSIPSPPLPPELVVDATTKTADSSISLSTILVKPEAIAAGVASTAAVATAVRGDSILSYTFAAVIVLASAVMAFYLIDRIRKSHA